MCSGHRATIRAQPSRCSLRFHDPDSKVRKVAFQRIDAANPLYYDEYVRALNDRDIDIRHAASVALGENTHPKVIEALLRNMKSDDPFIRGYTRRRRSRNTRTRACSPLFSTRWTMTTTT